ncbi:tyrosine-type recombinase/integrase [Chromobacterium sphagni]|uniref:tyrosine-type recombinase/integrase n=1 Tax=Chromobacterium sphagni TaxID=1903179 RepID=UPI0019D3FB90|nr:integrase arm-type DNA-binding domain-containing protein [Chromobacterium sphagni]
MALTAQTVKHIQPAEKLTKKADGGGLFLWVYPNGAKYWRWRGYLAGKEKLLAIGVYCGPAQYDEKGALQPSAIQMGLKEAREARDAAKRLLDEGKDPGKKRAEAKKLAHVSTENNLEAVAREWHHKSLAKWVPDHANRILRRFEMDVFPHIGAEPVDALKTHHLLDILRKVEARGSLDVASRLQQHLVAVMRYAVQTGRISTNLALDLQGALIVPEKQHRAALPLNQLPELIDRINNYHGRLLTRAALRLTLLTFLRSSELRMARWGGKSTSSAASGLSPHARSHRGRALLQSRHQDEDRACCSLVPPGAGRAARDSPADRPL